MQLALPKLSDFSVHFTVTSKPECRNGAESMLKMKNANFGQILPWIPGATYMNDFLEEPIPIN